MRSTRAILAIVFAAMLGGCGHSHGGGSTTITTASGPSGTTTTVTTTTPPPPPAPVTPLIAQVTNESTASIEVFVSTPDEDISLGIVDPGQTVQVNLDELPAYATFSATAVTANAAGVVPAFPSATVWDGTDFSDTDAFVGIAWQDGLVFDPPPKPNATVVAATVTKK